MCAEILSQRLQWHLDQPTDADHGRWPGSGATSSRIMCIAITVTLSAFP
jgi:hypothetical protein